jgi:hypothetical protein
MLVCTPGDAQLNYGCAEPHLMRLLQMRDAPVAEAKWQRSACASPALLIADRCTVRHMNMQYSFLYPRPDRTAGQSNSIIEGTGFSVVLSAALLVSR